MLSPFPRLQDMILANLLKSENGDEAELYKCVPISIQSSQALWLQQSASTYRTHVTYPYSVSKREGDDESNHENGYIHTVFRGVDVHIYTKLEVRYNVKQSHDGWNEWDNTSPQLHNKKPQHVASLIIQNNSPSPRLGNCRTLTFVPSDKSPLIQNSTGSSSHLHRH